MSSPAASASRSPLIAGKLTGDDWFDFAKTLKVGGEQDVWAAAFEIFFRQRLVDRYFTPIRKLQLDGAWTGEGFAIVSIQCAVIEFLAATREGLTYKQRARGTHEYSKSGELYRRFLTTAPLFSALFTKDLAEAFYKSIRCALLHEARTNDGWRIRASGTVAVRESDKTVFRNQLEKLIEDYVEDYGSALLSDTSLQSAFIRKFKNLAV